MRSKPFGIFVSWALCLDFFSPASAAPLDLIDLLPNQIETAKLVGPKERFVGKKLFDYMNGGAEIYLAFGFSEIGVASYQKDDIKISLEIYRMGGETEAFGIYSFASRGKDADLGVPSALSGALLGFFKDRYYVRVVARSNPTSAEKLLLTAAKKVLAQIPGKAQIPKEVELLPTGAQPGSLRFLPSAETARTVWFDGEGDVLLVSGSQAFTATYSLGDTDLQVTRVHFPSKEKSSQACQALAQKLHIAPIKTQADCSANGKTDDDLFTVISSKENILRWVSGAPDLVSANEWLAKIH